LNRVSPARVVLSFILLIFSAAFPPMLLLTVPFAIHTVFVIVARARFLARSRDAYYEHRELVASGKFWARR
jgi:hypothetical protein